VDIRGERYGAVRLDARYRAAARHDLLGAAGPQMPRAPLEWFRSVLDGYARRLDAGASAS
jgi:hypothetical protein